MALDDQPTQRYPRLRLRTILMALVSAGIVHICITFAWPLLAIGNPTGRIAALLPADGVRLLPVPPEGPQITPFQGPDSRYAGCRFNVSEAAYAIRAGLPESGWILSVYDAQGDSVYVATGQDQRRTEVAVLLLPPGDRFVGLLPEARLSAGFAQVVMPSATGIVMIRAPNKGTAYQASVEAELNKVTCVPRRP